MITDIIDKVIEKLGNRYTVIRSFDNEEEIDPEGILAVSAGNIEYFNHGAGTRDCKITLTISGDILTVEDKSQEKIYQMYEYVYNCITQQWLKDNIEHCAGVLMGDGSIVSDGESNNFSITADLYLSIDE